MRKPGLCPKGVQNEISLILNRAEMGISGTEKDFCVFIWTRLGIDFIRMSTFTFIQYILSIHINATVFGAGYLLFGFSVKLKS